MKNVILIVLDSLRKDHLGCYGNPWIKTPNLDLFYRESLSFSQAYPETLATLPVRRSLMTGRRVFPFKDWKGSALGDFIAAPGWQPLADTDITISEIFFEAGYETGFVTDVYHLFKPSMNFHRGFTEWRFIRGQELDLLDCSRPEVNIDHFVTPRMKGLVSEKQTAQYLTNVRHRKGEEDHFAPKVFQESIDFIERNKDTEKFYLHIDCFDPHEPWDPPAKYWSLYDDPEYKGTQVICPDYGDPLEFMNERELAHVKALYAGEVTMVDTWFGKFMNKVKELNLDKNSIIVMISDHGHPLGEHGLIRKTPMAMYPELMDIPLMIRFPDASFAGQQKKGYVYNHDVFSTILSYAEIPIDWPVDGIDLTKEHQEREYATSAFKGTAWAKNDYYAYFSLMNGEEGKLFDLDTDPDQHVNIIKDKPNVAKEMFNLILDDAGGSLPDFSSLQGQLTAPRFSTALSLNRR